MSYAPRPWLVAALALGALLAALLALGQDTPGRVLLGAVALVLAAEAVRSVVVRPVLTADADGFTYAGEHHAWAEVSGIGTLRGDRPRRRANVLEIDLGDRLLHVPGYRLGAPVDEVAAALGTFTDVST